MIDETINVPCVQFLRPDGEERHGAIGPIPAPLLKNLKALEAAGLRLEAEELSTLQISLTFAHAEFGDAGIRIVPNGPEVLEAVVDMLENSEKILWRLDMLKAHE